MDKRIRKIKRRRAMGAIATVLLRVFVDPLVLLFTGEVGWSKGLGRRRTVQDYNRQFLEDGSCLEERIDAAENGYLPDETFDMLEE